MIFKEVAIEIFSVMFVVMCLIACRRNHLNISIDFAAIEEKSLKEWTFHLINFGKKIVTSLLCLY